MEISLIIHLYYSYTHTLTVNEDFTSTSMNITFLEDADLRCVDIPIIDDSSISEGNEQFMVTFTVFTPGVETGVPNVSYVTIVDNDSMCSLSMVVVLQIVHLLMFIFIPFSAFTSI